MPWCATRRGDTVAASGKGAADALMVTSQIAMAAITLSAAVIACLPLPSLFSVALFAFQIMMRLARPLYLGIFTRFGDRWAALGSVSVGIVTVCVLQTLWPVGIPWAYGLTSGAVALAVNLTVYVGVALVTGRTPAEQRRLDALFAGADLADARARGATHVPRGA